VATELFAQRGWAGTPLAAIAAEAGVAVDTIYTCFGSKTGLLAAAKDVAKVGDTDQIPLMRRAGFDRLGEGPPSARLQLAATLIAEVNERTRPLDAVWREAAASDPELAATRRRREANRRRDVADGLARTSNAASTTGPSTPCGR
jgi:TetR/AcrR family transcriptional regulator of autoinduction and epiphytic fitness